MPEPNTSDRNSHGSRVHEISDRKIVARFSGRLPTTRCGEGDRRLLRFSNGLWFLRSRSITHADRDDSKIRPLDDKGPFFQVKGPMNIARCPQGHPVIIQAGGSPS